MKKYVKTFQILAVFLIFVALTVAFFVLENRNANIPHMETLKDAALYSLAAFLSSSYGDLVVLSFWGKVVGVTFILFGICFLGLIIGGASNLIAKQFEKRKLGYMGTKFKNHIVIIGWDSFSEDVTIQLVKADRKVAVLTNNKDDVDAIYRQFNGKNVFVCFSGENQPDTHALLNTQNAAAVFLNNGSDTDKLISIISMRQTFPHVQLIVLLENAKLKSTFICAGVTYVLSKDEIAAKLFASYIFEPAVADFTCDLIASATHADEAQYDIQQYRVSKTNPYINTQYGTLFRELKEKYNILPIGLNKSQHSDRGLIKLPSDKETVELGDDIIVIVNGKTECELQALFKCSEGI